MTSTIKADVVTAQTTNGNVTVQGNGTGKVRLGDGNLIFPDADAAAGQILTTDGSANLAFAATPGTSGNVLTSKGSAWTSAAAAGGGSWNIIGTAEASDSASLTITGLDSTYDMYAIGISNLHPASTAIPWIRFGDASGIDSGASDYSWWVGSWNATAEVRSDTNDSEIEIFHQDGVGAATGAGYSAMLWLGQSAYTTILNQISGTFSGENNGYARYTGLCGGSRRQEAGGPIVLDRIQLLMATGNITAGRMTVWGIAHA